MMMNVLALGLVVTSLLTAGIFTPSPETKDVIVKEGHRVVVVEYEKEDGNTKVLISPQQHEHSSSHPSHGKLSDAVSDVKDKLSEKIEVAEEKIKELGVHDQHHRVTNPKELICDAYGKCKEKIEGFVGRTKEAATHKAHETADKAYEVEGDAKETASDALSEVKDQVTHATDKTFDQTREVRDRVSEKGGEMKEEAKKRAQDMMAKAEKHKDKVSEKASEVRKETHKELSEISSEAREVAIDVFHYVLSPERVASISKVLHVMGFSTAYGMCLWVTFASSYVLAGALTRQHFGMVQSKIYPVYFKAMAYSLGLALLGQLMMSSYDDQRKNKWLLLPTSCSTVGTMLGGSLNLMTSLVLTLVNLLVLEPRASKVMLERMKEEKEEGRGKGDSAPETGSRGTTATTAFVRDHGKHSKEESDPDQEIIRLTQKLQRLNSYSSFLNVVTLTSLTWHLVNLANRLDHTNYVC